MNRKKSRNSKIGGHQELPLQPVFKFSHLFNANYRLITAILILLPALIYSQVYDFEFVWDDNINHTGHLSNPFILNPSWGNFIGLFSAPYFNMYIPITYFSWGGLKVLAELLSFPLNSTLHLSNVIVHIVNGLLVFTILKQFVLNKWAVLIGTLFFLLHPIQVEVVAWVSELRTLLAFCFSLTALYIYLKNQLSFSYWSLLLFILATLSKPSAVVLVPFVFAINYYYNFKLSKNIEKILPFALIALFSVVLAHSIQAQVIRDVLPHQQNIFAWLDSMVFYLSKVIYPYHLSASYALSPKFISSQWWFYPLAILPLALGYWLWLKRKIQPLIIFAALLFVAGFFTTSGLVSFSFQKNSLVADRYLYFAFIGVALFIATIINKADKKIILGLVLSILLVFVSLSVFRQIPVWENSSTLWLHSVKYEVVPLQAHTNLANVFNRQAIALAKDGKNQQAIVYFNKAMAYYPAYSTKNLSGNLYNRGTVFLVQKQYQKALNDFNQVLKVIPNHSGAYNKKIVIYMILKQCQPAKITVKQAQQRKIKLSAETLTILKQQCTNP